MGNSHEQKVPLTPGRMLEKKLNHWVGIVRTSSLSEKTKENVEAVIMGCLPKNELEEIAKNPKQVIILHEILGSIFTEISEEEKIGLEKVLLDVGNHIETMRATEN